MQKLYLEKIQDMNKKEELFGGRVVGPEGDGRVTRGWVNVIEALCIHV
jgi:hypothetical protein